MMRIIHSLAVRPDEPNTKSVCNFCGLCLEFFSLGASFAKASSDDDRPSDTFFAAILQRLRHKSCRDNEDCQIRRLLQIFDVCVYKEVSHVGT